MYNRYFEMINKLIENNLLNDAKKTKIKEQLDYYKNKEVLKEKEYIELLDLLK